MNPGGPNDPRHLGQMPRAQQGTPVLLHDEGLLTTGSFVSMLHRDPNRKNVPFNKNFLPFPEEQTIISNPVGMFGDLLAKHPPRATAAVNRTYQNAPDIEAMMRSFVPFNNYYAQTPQQHQSQHHQQQQQQLQQQQAAMYRTTVPPGWFNNSCGYCTSSSHSTRYCPYGQPAPSTNGLGYNSVPHTGQHLGGGAAHFGSSIGGTIGGHLTGHHLASPSGRASEHSPVQQLGQLAAAATAPGLNNNNNNTPNNNNNNPNTFGPQ